MKYGTPQTKSTLTLKQVDEFLEELTTVRTEDLQLNVFSKILPKLTAGVERNNVHDYNSTATTTAAILNTCLHFLKMIYGILCD